jgi:hypothetical protein
LRLQDGDDRGLECAELWHFAEPEHLAAMQRVPAVMDFNILVDMGRMNPRWLWAEKLGCSPVRIAAGSGRP